MAGLGCAQPDAGDDQSGLPCPNTPPGLPAAGARCYVCVKTGIEWIASLILLVITLPIIVGLVILIRRASHGPAFYSQLRLGRNGKAFRIYKLRTMAHGCEAATGPVWSIAGDPRATKIGAWLRETHLDELPQLWNVLRGDMSLIGPRPERPEIAADIECALPQFRSRLLVKPGITGLAQMRLQADSDLDTVREKLAHDLQYIRNIGPGLDVRIALATVFHSIGWAGTTASRRLVQHYAPTQPVVLPARQTSDGKPNIAFRLDAYRDAPESVEVSRAA